MRNPRAGARKTPQGKARSELREVSSESGQDAEGGVGLVARKTPHRFRPKTTESASPLGEGEDRRLLAEVDAATQLLTGFGRGRPNPGSSPGQALTLPSERVKSRHTFEDEGRSAKVSLRSERA